MSSLNISKITTIIDELKENIEDYDVFVETGTLIGDTVIGLSSFFNELHTIELAEKYYQLSTERVKNEGLSNIKTYLGDSTYVLPKIISRFNENNKIIFWLDGHWSSGDTGKGEKDCPLIEECAAIDKNCKSEKAILLIDDYRLFGKKLNEDWSDISIDGIKKCFNNYTIPQQLIHDDVLCFLLLKNEYLK
jgi:hypothetical protein